MKKVPKMHKLVLRGEITKFLSDLGSYSVFTIKITTEKKLRKSDTFEFFVNFEILTIFEIKNGNFG